VDQRQKPIKVQSKKILEENFEETLCDLGVDKHFLGHKRINYKNPKNVFHEN
jgi:hypothetical protein